MFPDSRNKSNRKHRLVYSVSEIMTWNIQCVLTGFIHIYCATRAPPPCTLFEYLKHVNDWSIFSWNHTTLMPQIPTFSTVMIFETNSNDPFQKSNGILCLSAPGMMNQTYSHNFCSQLLKVSEVQPPQSYFQTLIPSSNINHHHALPEKSSHRFHRAEK